jgi:CO dehydrogenase/acetyl-CoA synthase epsilon subunit
MYLIPKDWTKTPVQKYVLTEQKKTQIKADIKGFVNKPKLYKEVIEHIQEGLLAEGKHVRDDEILTLVKEIAEEWKPVEVEPEGMEK